MKKLFIYTLIMFSFMSIITIISFMDDDNEIKKKGTNIFKDINNYKDYNLNRYINYKKTHKFLNNYDVVTQVNIGLDYPFYTNTKESNMLNNTSILVNKYIFLPSNYIPNNLVEIDGKYLVSEALNKYKEMSNDALDNGYRIRIISAYRSYFYQKKLYDNYVSNDGIEKADLYSARPGFSEHQTGLVIDIDNYVTNYEDFDKTKEFIWISNNSYKYGFILRYPKDKEYITGYQYESWHYRYVGYEIAKYIYENNITFDEYYYKFIDK